MRNPVYLKFNAKSCLYIYIYIYIYYIYIYIYIYNRNLALNFK